MCSICSLNRTKLQFMSDIFTTITTSASPSNGRALPSKRVRKSPVGSTKICPDPSSYTIAQSISCVEARASNEYPWIFPYPYDIGHFMDILGKVYGRYVVMLWLLNVDTSVIRFMVPGNIDHISTCQTKQASGSYDRVKQLNTLSLLVMLKLLATCLFALASPRLYVSSAHTRAEEILYAENSCRCHRAACTDSRWNHWLPFNPEQISSGSRRPIPASRLSIQGLPNRPNQSLAHTSGRAPLKARPHAS